jgi:hypothetical protein
MKKKVIIPIYENIEQSNEELKKYNFSFIYKIGDEYYYMGENVSLPENIDVLEIPYSEIYIQLTGGEESIGLTYLENNFITFNSLD